jgi:hypothetical protein
MHIDLVYRRSSPEERPDWELEYLASSRASSSCEGDGVRTDAGGVIGARFIGGPLYA